MVFACTAAARRTVGGDSDYCASHSLAVQRFNQSGFTATRDFDRGFTAPQFDPPDAAGIETANLMDEVEHVRRADSRPVLQMEEGLRRTHGSGVAVCDRVWLDTEFK